MLVAGLVMAACVSMHAGGLTSALRWIRGWRMTDRFWRMSSAFAAIAGWMIVLHVVEILVCEALTGILRCGWSTAFFFAAVSHLYQSRSGGT